MTPLRFRHEVIDPDPPGAHHDITLLTDLTGNGLPDIIIGCKEGEFNLFWYENPGPGGGEWRRHMMAPAPELEAGGALLDINGDGRLDIIAGQQFSGNELYWFEQPPDPRGRWPKRVIENRFRKYHDQTAGDVDGDGQPEVVFLSQISGVLAYYDIPADPTVEPWPEESFHLIAEGQEDVEGLVIADLNGDGRNEIVAGTCVWQRSKAGLWQGWQYVEGYVMTRVAVADLDGDDWLEIVVCEGESDPGRLAWVRPDRTGSLPVGAGDRLAAGPTDRVHLLRDDLFHPHSLQIADLDGDGLPDIFVAEMGLGRNPDPRMFVYLNRGGGEFEETLVHRGVSTHEARIGDMNGDGRPDIVGKTYWPERHVDVWWNVATTL